jgi:hypothetical protein
MSGAFARQSAASAAASGAPVRLSVTQAAKPRARNKSELAHYQPASAAGPIDGDAVSSMLAARRPSIQLRQVLVFTPARPGRRRVANNNWKKLEHSRA